MDLLILRQTLFAKMNVFLLRLIHNTDGFTNKTDSNNRPDRG